MEPNLEEVRREIEQTRARIAEKINRLQEEVERTKRTTLNPAYHARTRPWRTLGIAILAGWILGRMVASKRRRRNNHAPSDNRSAYKGVPKNRRRSLFARAALAGIRATVSSLIVRDLAKALVRDYVRHRWSRRRRG
ncbi:MAG: hypothetical protein ACREQK_03255 [Candidatus Binatia bacterium]